MDANTVAGWDLRYSAGDRCPTRNGGELYFERYGAGTPIVFLNNFFTIAPAWRNFTGRVRSTCTVIAYDLQNQGASSQPGSTLSFRENTEDLIDLMDHLGVGSAYLVGTSISTLIALEAARRHPKRVRGLILVGPAFSPGGEFRLTLLLKEWRRRLDEGGPRALFQYLYPLVFSDCAIERGGRPMYLALRERFLALNSHEQIDACLLAVGDVADGSTLFRQTGAPTLIVIGDSDYLWGAATLDDACGLRVGTTGQILRQAGHLPFVEQTERFEEALLGFVTATEQASTVGVS